jgi:hypothetical protein
MVSRRRRQGIPERDTGGGTGGAFPREGGGGAFGRGGAGEELRGVCERQG